jgi:hypothetical protein
MSLKLTPDQGDDLEQIAQSNGQDATSKSHAQVAVSCRPNPPQPGAFYGLAGRITAEIAPHTESDAVAILGQLLVLAGSAMGPGPRFRVEGTTHGTNEFVLLVGETSRGRKGTSLRQAEAPLRLADADWATECTAQGLSSGEGAIHAVRDPTMKTVDGELQVTDAGVEDKRLAIIETEFSSPLRVMGREGSILSAVLRNAFDGGDLRVMTRNNPLKATGTHISVVGHITVDELRRELSTTEAGNGFANRFLFLSVYRSKELPDGGEAHRIDWQPIVEELRRALEFAGSLTAPIARDGEARELWHALYRGLTKGHPGMLGSLTSRGEAHVTRLALIHAVLERSSVITADHLSAAMALWEYSERSVRHIFGDALGDPVADDVLRALRQEGDEGLTRTQIRDLFGRHKRSDRIDGALALLLKLGRARMTRRDTGGRPVEVWTAT